MLDKRTLQLSHYGHLLYTKKIIGEFGEGMRYVKGTDKVEA